MKFTKKMNKISLAIPFYNSSKYVFDALKYCINDEMVSEIIFNDDCSKESEYHNLLHIVSELKNEKIKVYKNSSNVGAFRNKYKVVEKCTNEWIYLLDCDNYFFQNSLDNIRNINLNSNICYLPSSLHLSDGEIVEYQFKDEFIGIKESKEYLKDNVRYIDWILNMGNFLVHKKRYLSSIQSAYEDTSLTHLHADVFAFSYYWFIFGGKYKLIKNFSYNHRLRSDSYWHLCENKSQESVDYYTNKILELNNNSIEIVDCPEKFLPKMPVVYPPHQGNNPMIEERAYSFFKTIENLKTDYIYIPIQWTSFHINNDYGKNIEPLQNYCNSIVEKYPNKKFFTIVQYDGGTLVEIDNCTIFGCSGDFDSPLGKNSRYEPIPLLSDPHQIILAENKKYKVGYAGWDTHPIRSVMYETLHELDGYRLERNLCQNKTEIFKDILSNSIFALCPRGYGPASYRMYEAIQFGCIPIYISDEFWLPFSDKIDWDKLCVLIKEDEIETISEKVNTLLETKEYLNMISYGKEVYEKYLTWDGCLNTIVDYIT